MAWLVLRSTIIADKKLRWILFGLRFVTLAVLVWILADPAMRQPVRSPKPKTETLFLVDTSASMDIEFPESRMAQAKRIIAPAMTNTSLKKHAHLYSFSNSLCDKPVPLADYKKFEPNGGRTMLGESLYKLLEETKNMDVANIVLCTDGRIGDLSTLGQAVVKAKTMGIKIYSVKVGSKVPQFNMAIRRCEAPLSAAPHTPVTVKVTVQGQETLDEKLMLSVISPDTVDGTGKKIKGKTVVSKEITASKDEKTYNLTFNPKNESGVYTVHLQHYKEFSKDGKIQLRGELTYKDNDCKFNLKVEDPKIRVLYMEGTIEKYRDNPKQKEKKLFAWEIFRNAITDKGKIEVDVYYVNQQVQIGGKLINARTKEYGLPKTKEEFFKYDVVICSDVNKKVFTPDQIKWVRELVLERGGGFVMIGGRTAFGSGYWQKTDWEKMIPMQMELKRGRDRVWAPFKPVIDENALDHPIMQIFADDKKNKEAFKLHPQFMGTNIIQRAKPGATVLMRHPIRGLDGKYSYRGRPRYNRRTRKWVYPKNGKTERMPIVAVQKYGKGRSMAFTSDAAGGWGEPYMAMWGPKNQNNKYYRKFWQNAIRWLAENSIAKQGSAVVGGMELVSYKPGEIANVRAKVFTHKGKDIQNDSTVKVYVKGYESEAVRLKLDKDREEFVGKLKIPGDIKTDKITVIFEGSKDGKPIGKDVLSVRILQLGDELVNPKPDFSLLETVVDRTKGRILRTRSDIKKLMIETQERQKKKSQFYIIPLWDSPWIWGLIIVVCTIEWFLRKRVVMS